MSHVSGRSALILVLNFVIFGYDIVASPLEEVQSSVMSMSVCVSVCPLTYLENHMVELHQFLCMLPAAVAPSFSVGVAMYFRFCR